MDVENDRSEKIRELLENNLAKTAIGKYGEESILEHTELVKKAAFDLYDIGYIDEYTYNLLSYVCEKHDYGKINDKMQHRMKNKYACFNPDEEIQHNILSALFVLKKDFGVSKNDSDYLAVLYAVLYHHPNRTDKSSFTSILGNSNDLIDDFRKKYSEFVADKIDKPALKKIGKIMANRECDRDELTDEDLELLDKCIRLKGLLHKCDYSASAHIKCEYPNNFLIFCLNNLAATWHDGWNDLQKFMMDNTDRNVIVTAPTGSGKTEAGLLWAGNNKCFFVLPLRTAINAMYERIKGILGNGDVDTRLALLHSDMQSYYLSDRSKDEDRVDVDDFMDYVTKSKQISLPITVATLDQIFDFSLKYYGYELKLSTFSYSKIIIDEIQMYSPDLLVYLVYGVKLITRFGGKVAVLTATMPPFAKKELENVLGDDIAIRDFSYLKSDRHNVEVLDKKLEAGDIWHKWKSLDYKDSRKTLVVCNCIETAQKIYNELNELSQADGIDVKINLLHSRYTRVDRRIKESCILDVGNTSYKSHEIWISTSIVEASLDIDFDYLFTELLELFSLFQRMGRVNRKGLKSIDEANCFIYLQLRDAPERHYRSTMSDMRFVDDDIYDLSREAMRTVSGVFSEQRKTELINTYMSVEKLEASDYVKKYKKKYQTLEEFYIEENSQEPIRDIHNIDMIPYPVYKENEDVIERCETIIKDGSSDVTDRLKAIEYIRDYMISVPWYLVKPNVTKTEKDILLKKHFKVPVVHCKYDSEIGLQEIFQQERVKHKKGDNFL